MYVRMLTSTGPMQGDATIPEKRPATKAPGIPVPVEAVPNRFLMTKGTWTSKSPSILSPITKKMSPTKLAT